MLKAETEVSKRRSVPLLCRRAELLRGKRSVERDRPTGLVAAPEIELGLNVASTGKLTKVIRRRCRNLTSAIAG
jgi:hypothetical protein